VIFFVYQTLFEFICSYFFLLCYREVVVVVDFTGEGNIFYV